MNHFPEGPSSYWLDTPAEVHPPLSAHRECEVLVIGGGISGITLAWTLAEQGRSAVLLEARRIAGAASGRNAGFLLAAPSEPYEEQIALWGRAGARAVLDTGRRTHRRVRELVETLGLDCDYRANGSLRLSTGEEERDDTRRSLPLMRADGFAMDEIPLAGQVPEHAEAAFTAAFFTPEDGELHPVRFLRQLARAAADRGIGVHEDSEMTTARWRDGAWHAATPGGTVRAETLVLCTNAWAPQLLQALAPVIVPRRGQMLATAPLDRVVAPLPAYAHWGYRYWRQAPDGRLLIGGWRDTDRDVEVGYGIEPTAKVQSGIEQGLRLLVPEGAPIEHRWAGTMAFARDGRPLVGWLDADHHLALCAGFTGHGMGMAAACTQDLAELLAWRQAPGIATYDPGRFPELRHGLEEFTALGARG